jgi:hypothetical protein
MQKDGVSWRSSGASSSLWEEYNNHDRFAASHMLHISSEVTLVTAYVYSKYNCSQEKIQGRITVLQSKAFWR